MFSRLLIANRAEIAVRIARTCRELGVTSIAVHSDADAGGSHVRAADEAIRLPGVAPADTYLNVEGVLDAARRRGAEAIHPGYGFLAESADFAHAVTDAGLVWVGPPADAIRALGDKISARRLAVRAGVPVVPGLTDSVEDGAELRSFAHEYGFPVAIKASGGGGGRGLKIAHSEEELDGAFESARREARAYFGSSVVYAEKYLEAPKHLEVQVLAPAPDDALWLGVRDCSLQRRHQKLIEETPPPRWAERSEEMGGAAVALSKASGYVNAGTVEMLVDPEGEFYFLEVNSRLQVEHTVTEETFGVDLVACQLRIAAGDSLDLAQPSLVPHGHAIECRINAEDPARDFAPAPGVITRFEAPAGFGVRVDGGYDAGDEVPSAYDSLIAKVISWGVDRDDARARMLRALDELVVDGVTTTAAALRLLLEDPSFVAGDHTTRTVEQGDALDALEVSEVDEEKEDVLVVGGGAVRLWNPSMAHAATAAVRGRGATGELLAPMHATVARIAVEEGSRVEAGDPVVVLETMKMETTVAAPTSGRVTHIAARPGTTVGAGERLAVIE
jgi:acetyl-CoA/propionyl-CoA carboxylase, biotin carboxylase, biotin carboxyl carrier protein